ncbi:hypothetical protein PHYSODRAFT_490419 [Phytophthora sojae]|uniref:Reverse transcriptase domain-containing protein n=1 Tax=Phytophthora sojae (strain P6497) TaxID=1094619 RepID=G4Z6A4_PHYSP|nr:hypothetical protein PHYSODRAFT_490419 [Phytophthora sojae]EGZ21719.1 hypothetical protein PHYSODRAFT_490419 [Phytophthora sojae]|eukprot:XP_009524436.1 hypothetical protein PHYSODRAFT_490419 [Phytophthora sojae]
MAPTTKSATAHFQLLKLSTQIKLGELTKHERKLETHYTELLAKTGLDGDDVTPSADAEQARKKLEGLYEGVKDLQVVQTNVHEGLEDIGGLVEFAAADPWSTETVVEQRKQQILREVRQRRSLWQHNKLLGELLMESLEETEHDQEDGELVRPQDGAPESTTLGAEAGNEPLAKLSREETQQRLESYFFQSSGVSEDEVFEFLKTEVFQEREGFSKARTQRQQDALHQARSRLGEFGDTMLSGESPVSEEDVSCCVAALLRDKAFLNPSVVALFTDAQRNKQITKELSHVLTIELSNVKEWRWPEDGVHVDIQRGMNGRFRCLLQEEAITLLLFHDKPWMSGTASVESVRADMMRKFQMFALPDSMRAAGRSPYDEDGTESDGDEEEEDQKADKQDIIRRVLVEAHLQSILASDGNKPSPLVAVMTDLEFFGPSVSHEAVFAILRFLGIRDDMLGVFRAYTKIPLLFPGFEEPKVMQRGLPVSRMMTMLLAEVKLFVMDYLVLVSSDVFLYRSHDDICFFDADEAKVLRAWREMQRYAQRVGLAFNEEKSGSIRLYAGASTTEAEVGSAPLPATPIRWGLLELQSNGSVKILQDEVEAFATEMADRLAAATSTFAWINVYNKYMFFFLRNFGKPSPIFGLSHVQDALSTLRRIHTLVFPKTNGDALGYLRDQVMSGRSGAAPAMPAAWAYWPLNLGGLGLCNPFLAVWDVQNSLYAYLEMYHTRVGREWPKLKKDWEWQSPFSTVFEELKQQYDVFAEQTETEGFEWIKKRSENERFAYMKSSKFSDKQRNYGRSEPKLDHSFTLRSFEEYVKLLPSLMDTRLSTEFNDLLSEAEECAPPLPNGYLSEWVAFIYSAQVMEVFGTLSFFSRELLPAQLIESIKKKTVTW